MNLSALVRSHASQRPEAIALFCGDRTLSFAALDRSTDSLAAWLLGEGLTAGDRVAFLWPNA